MVPLFANSNKKEIHFKELLTHSAGLVSWIPFYKATLDTKEKPLAKYYRKNADSQFSKQVADSLFIRNDYHDTIMKMIVDFFKHFSLIRNFNIYLYVNTRV
jgi:hypothetical protein